MGLSGVFSPILSYKPSLALKLCTRSFMVFGFRGWEAPAGVTCRWAGTFVHIFYVFSSFFVWHLSPQVWNATGEENHKIFWLYSDCWSVLSGGDDFFISSSEVYNDRPMCHKFSFFVFVREQQWTQGAICAAQTVKWPILCKVLSTGPVSQSRQVINQNASKVESLLMSGQKNQLS